MEVGEEGDYIPISLHSHHQNDSCIKMGIDESHFNVSLIVRDKVTRQCPQTTTFEEKGEPRSLCLPASRFTARPNRLTTDCCSMAALLIVIYICGDFGKRRPPCLSRLTGRQGLAPESDSPARTQTGPKAGSSYNQYSTVLITTQHAAHKSAPLCPLSFCRARFLSF